MLKSLFLGIALAYSSVTFAGTSSADNGAVTTAKCPDILESVVSRLSGDGSTFCFYGHCWKVSHVSEKNDLSYFGELQGSGISIKFHLRNTTHEMQIEGLVLEHGLDTLTVLTESGIKVIQSRKIVASHIVIFETDIKPETKVSLVYKNTPIRLALLATENPSDYIYFNFDLNRKVFDLVARIKSVDDGFILESADGEDYLLEHSVIENAVQRGGSYQVLKGL